MNLFEILTTAIFLGVIPFEKVHLDAYRPHPQPLPDFREGRKLTSPPAPLHFVEREEKRRIGIDKLRFNLEKCIIVPLQNNHVVSVVGLSRAPVLLQPSPECNPSRGRDRDDSSRCHRSCAGRGRR